MRTSGRACTRWSLVGDLGHELILFVSYPHERCFGVQGEAALLEFELVLAAFAEARCAKDFAARARDTTANKRTVVHLATERTKTMPQLALYGSTRYWLVWRTARGALLACTCRRAGALAALCEKVAGRRAASLAELRT